MKLRQIGIILLTAAVLVVNYMGGAGLINDTRTGEIANSFTRDYFLPANYVFGIWGIIYTWLIAFTVYQALPAGRDNAMIERIAPLYALNIGLNIAWVFSFHYRQFVLANFLLIAILLSLLAIVIRAGIGTRRVSAADHWLVHMPFFIYFAWLCVATIASMAQTLVALEWDGFGIASPVWISLMTVVAAVLAVAMLVWREGFAFAAVVVWALAGLAARYADEPLISTTAWASVAVIVVVGAALAVMRLRNGARTPARAA
jgi:tryptophan-rich sensory protein